VALFTLSDCPEGRATHAADEEKQMVLRTAAGYTSRSACKIAEVLASKMRAVGLAWSTGRENEIQCSAFVPPPSYGYLAALSGLKKRIMAVSLAEYVITGVRDKAIWLWDSCGKIPLFKSLVGWHSILEANTWSLVLMTKLCIAEIFLEEEHCQK
jgi:hypothetical protein